MKCSDLKKQMTCWLKQQCREKRSVWYFLLPSLTKDSGLELTSRLAEKEGRITWLRVVLSVCGLTSWQIHNLKLGRVLKGKSICGPQNKQTFNRSSKAVVLPKAKNALSYVLHEPPSQKWSVFSQINSLLKSSLTWIEWEYYRQRKQDWWVQCPWV